MQNIAKCLCTSAHNHTGCRPAKSRQPYTSSDVCIRFLFRLFVTQSKTFIVSDRRIIVRFVAHDYFIADTIHNLGSRLFGPLRDSLFHKVGKNGPRAFTRYFFQGFQFSKAERFSCPLCRALCCALCQRLGTGCPSLRRIHIGIRRRTSTGYRRIKRSEWKTRHCLRDGKTRIDGKIPDRRASNRIFNALVGCIHDRIARKCLVIRIDRSVPSLILFQNIFIFIGRFRIHQCFDFFRLIYPHLGCCIDISFRAFQSSHRIVCNTRSNVSLRRISDILCFIISKPCSCYISKALLKLSRCLLPILSEQIIIHIFLISIQELCTAIR